MSHPLLWPLRPLDKLAAFEYRLYLRMPRFWQKTTLVLIAFVTLEELVTTSLSLFTYLLKNHGLWVWSTDLTMLVVSITSLALEIYCLAYIRKLALARQASRLSTP